MHFSPSSGAYPGDFGSRNDEVGPPSNIDFYWARRLAYLEPIVESAPIEAVRCFLLRTAMTEITCSEDKGQRYQIMNPKSSPEPEYHLLPHTRHYRTILELVNEE